MACKYAYQLFIYPIKIIGGIAMSEILEEVSEETKARILAYLKEKELQEK